MHLVVVDTKAGNFGSVLNALNKVGASVDVTQDKAKIEKAKALVLPGVAAFKRGMDGLNEAGLVDIIRKQVSVKKVPVIGICLGMQLLAKSGVEGSIDGRPMEGMGFIDGHVGKLEANDPNYRIPNIGWHNATPKKKCILFPNMNSVESFYHVHSYHMSCKDKADVAASISFSGQEITVAVERENIFGLQFHPEKSQDAGLDLLERFVNSLS